MGPLATKIKSACAHFKFYILNLSVLGDVRLNLTVFVELSLSNIGTYKQWNGHITEEISDLAYR